tara:strand:- start:2745 stop:2945 length:201 start_codon:yes stop_codon:yes gene_type:complete
LLLRLTTLSQNVKKNAKKPARKVVKSVLKAVRRRVVIVKIATVILAPVRNALGLTKLRHGLKLILS